MATKTINLDTPTVAKAEPADRPAKPVYNPLPEEVKAAIEFLITTAAKHDVIVSGFAFSAKPPRVCNFGNCADSGELRLYVTLCDFSEKQRRAGHVLTEKVGGLVQ